MTRRGLLALPLAFGWLSACSSAPPTNAAPPPSGERANMLQVMRAFPFPHSNVIFDTQSVDPEGAEKKTSMSFSVYRWEEADTYAGWEGVENSALALIEMAPILLVPRACANGKPAPVERDDWKRAVDGLATTGEVALKAARARNMDAMLDVGEKLANACAACHDLYRDVDLSGGERCTLPK